MALKTCAEAVQAEKGFIDRIDLEIGRESS
jgi:hypothetical protein